MKAFATAIERNELRPVLTGRGPQEYATPENECRMISI